MAETRFRTEAEFEALIAETGNPFASIPREVILAHLEAVGASIDRYNALNPPHVVYRRVLATLRDAIAQVDAMKHPTAEELRIQEDLIQRVCWMEDEGEPLPPLPDAKFTPTPPGMQ